MEIDELYKRLRFDLGTRLKLQDDKPDETIDSSLKALWLYAAGIPKSAEYSREQQLPELTGQQVIILNQFIEQRLNGVPLAYITGRQSFMGIELKADRRALIPRKETEILGRKALDISHKLAQKKKPVVIFDVCCGSGNLGLSLVHFQPDSYIFASDLSQEAVDLTSENISFLSLQQKAEVRVSDLFSSFENKEFYSKVDLIVCNPPYISSAKVSKMNSEISGFEPSMAFDGGMMGFKVIQKLISEAPKFLSKNGWLIFEVGLGQGSFIQQMCEKSQRYVQIGSQADKMNNIRVVYAALAD